MRRPGFSRTGLLAALLALGACDAVDSGTTTVRATEPHPPNLRYQLGDVAAIRDTTSAVQLSGAFRAAAATALPAVVAIRVTTTAFDRRTPPSMQDGGEDGPRRAIGSGSGFILDGDGHILTNHHVIRNAEQITVVLPDGRDYEAEIVGSDPNTDIGVIRIEPRPGETLPVSSLGDSDHLRVGDWVLALGNPLGLEFTVTAGIVSARDRTLGILNNEDNTQLEAFIQTDAAINPGNSGGPMVDLAGRVVGINSAIESQTGFFSGAGFAIPINLATKVARDLMESGVVHRPRLGVSIQDVNAADAELYRLPAISGAEISSVSPGDPADRAGVRMGDVVVAVDDEPVRSVSDLQTRIARLQPGHRVRLGIIRYGESLEATVELGEFAPARSRTAVEQAAPSRGGLLGFTVAPVSRAMAVRAGFREGAVQIFEVDPFGPASGHLPAGWLPLRINDRDIRSVRDVETIASSLRRGDIVSVVAVNPMDDPPSPTIYNYRVR